jgi:MtaA/CmuA family methyltransferase
MACLAAEIHRATGFNAVNLPWDACVELEALGGASSLGHSATDVPTPSRPAFERPEDVTIPEDFFRRGRLPVVLDAVKRTREKLGNEVVVVPLVEGPTNLACLTIGINRMYRMFIKNSRTASHILQIFAELCVQYGNRLLEAGGDVIQLSDPFAQGLTAGHFVDMVVPAYRRISAELKGDLFLHICGNTRAFLPHLPDSGFSAFSFDAPSVSTIEVKQALGDRMRAIGSVPTVSHILEGTKQEVFRASLRCIEDGVDILSPSCGFPPEASLENLRALGRAIQHHNRTINSTLLHENSGKGNA